MTTRLIIRTGTKYEISTYKHPSRGFVEIGIKSRNSFRQDCNTVVVCLDPVQLDVLIQDLQAKRTLLNIVDNDSGGFEENA